ncbi:MAG: hypothetical protein JWO63_1372 [Frankiales bacterium]|nr:hypothetical protein [Frankiales bacterium]
MTYSIVARDPASGQLAVASQSHYFALGRVVTFAQAGVGVVTTQSFVEPSYGPDGLALMAAGASAAAALSELLAADAERELRQVAFLDATGQSSMFTGARCVPAKGQLTGDNVVVLGNMLANDGVVPAMLAAYTSATGSLAERVLAALDAAEAAGGDARGRLSASLVIVSGQTGERPWSNRLIDVRVDEHPAPLVELRRLVELSDAHAVFGTAVFAPGLLSTDSPTAGPELVAALSAIDAAQAVIGADPEPTFWKGVLLVRAGELTEGRGHLERAIAIRPQYRDFVDGLHRVGILPAASRELLDA